MMGNKHACVDCIFFKEEYRRGTIVLTGIIKSDIQRGVWE